MRQFKVKNPNGGRRVTIWSRDQDQQPPYLEIPNGRIVWVEVKKAGPLAAPCELRRNGQSPYLAMVSLEDIPAFAPKPFDPKTGLQAVSGSPVASSPGNGSQAVRRPV